MMNSDWRLPVLAGCAAVAFGLAACSQTPDRREVGTTPQGIQATPAELREIVKEAYIYGFPMVDSYRIQHSYFVDQTNPEYKGAWNQPHSVARVYTPQDKAIQTPNSDTPYTFLGADLRAEPLVTPPHPSEAALMERFAKAGIGPGQSFDVAALSADQRQALDRGMAEAWQAFARFKKEEIDTGKKSSADGFGTREFLRNDYMMRMSAAVLGIYGNSKEEANYPVYFVDSEGTPLNGATSRYTVRFGPGQLPPVNAFWSLTMYQLPASLLTENPIDRYLINLPMEPNLIRDADGGITLYIQHESPGKNKEPNWLPAPKGPFFMVLREYWPKPEALNGSWKVPQAVRATQ